MSAPQTPPAPVGAPPPAAGDDHPPASPAKKYTRRAAIYVRVSTNKQTTENQELVLRQVAAARGWRVEVVYDDTGISGAKGADERPGLAALLADATRGRFDVAMFFKLDRMGRSVLNLHENAEHLKACGVEIYCHAQAIDTMTPTGKLMFTVLAGVAELERDLIRERVLAGLDRARARGKRLGRPKTDAATEATIRQQLAAGVGMNKIAAQLGVGKLTVQRIKKEMATDV